eukprot:6211208-Pleurochrysis_carterae.AAC.1
MHDSESQKMLYLSEKVSDKDKPVGTKLCQTEQARAQPLLYMLNRRGGARRRPTMIMRLKSLASIKYICSERARRLRSHVRLVWVLEESYLYRDSQLLSGDRPHRRGL